MTKPSPPWQEETEQLPSRCLCCKYCTDRQQKILATPFRDGLKVSTLPDEQELKTQGVPYMRLPWTGNGCFFSSLRKEQRVMGRDGHNRPVQLWQQSQVLPLPLAWHTHTAREAGRGGKGVNCLRPRERWGPVFGLHCIEYI